MKKMSCLFVREFVNNRIANITEVVTPGCEWVLAGEGDAFIKRDGTACAVIGGVLHRRYDAKRGKTPPPGAVPCDPAPDPVTGHWPHWLSVTSAAQDRWFMEAWLALPTFEPAYEHVPLPDGTYELCGPHFQANPERLDVDTFIKHDSEPVTELIADRTFDHLRTFVSAVHREGIVFHHPDGRMAKIRRADFGFAWPIVRHGDEA